MKISQASGWLCRTWAAPWTSIQQHVAALRPQRLYLRPVGAVAVAEHIGMLQVPAGGNPGIEGGAIDEVVLLAVELVAARWPGGIGNREA